MKYPNSKTNSFLAVSTSKYKSKAITSSKAEQMCCNVAEIRSNRLHTKPTRIFQAAFRAPGAPVLKFFFLFTEYREINKENSDYS